MVALPRPPVPQRTLILEGDPEAQLDYAQKAAKALMKRVEAKPRKVTINGRQYLEYGDWQTLGRFFGATVGTDWSRPIERNGAVAGYEARAIVHQHGAVISAAEASCFRAERNWSNRDEFALRSMAQTRASGKALRNAFGWVAELAGYASTPAEEMTSDEEDKPPPQVKAEPVPGPQTEAAPTPTERAKIWATNFIRNIGAATTAEEVAKLDNENDRILQRLSEQYNDIYEGVRAAVQRRLTDLTIISAKVRMPDPRTDPSEAINWVTQALRGFNTYEMAQDFFNEYVLPRESEFNPFDFDLLLAEWRSAAARLSPPVDDEPEPDEAA